jgi:hypothetical protein
VPLGDQAGSNSFASLFVRSVCTLVATSIVAISELPSAQQRSTAIAVPAGDQEGFPSITLSSVRRRDRVPSTSIW